MNLWFRLAAFFMMTAVVFGAFGTHALKGRLTDGLFQIYQTAALYHMVHALGLFAVAWAWSLKPSAAVRWAGVALTLGILFFSGTLYVLAITGVRWLGAVTPVGGLLFIAGWALLAFASATSAKK